MRRLLSIALATSAVTLTCAGTGSANPSPYYLGVNVSVEYGPACQKDAYGGEVCGTTPIRGIKVTLAATPSGKTISDQTSTARATGLTFHGNIPGVFDVRFIGTTNHHRYSGGWRTPNLSSLEQQPLRLFVLLCPNGGWVASVENIAQSCSDRSSGVLAWGAATGAA